MMDQDYINAKTHMEDLQAIARRERLAGEAKEQDKRFGLFSGWFKPKKVITCEPQTIKPLASQAE